MELKDALSLRLQGPQQRSNNMNKRSFALIFRKNLDNTITICNVVSDQLFVLKILGSNLVHQINHQSCTYTSMCVHNITGRYTDQLH